MTDNTTFQELNQQIWLAYQDAYHAGDTAAFLALHEPGLVRAGGGPVKQVSGFAQYALGITRWFADLASRGDNFDIAFRFTERITDGDVASERGVYRLTVTRADGEHKAHYGRFHVFTRRAEDRWRIVTDYDSDERGTVTAQDYDSAIPLDDVAAWQAPRLWPHG